MRGTVNHERRRVIIRGVSAFLIDTPSPLCREEAVTAIDHDQLVRALSHSDLCPTPAEAQGMLCGLICGGDPDPVSTWMSQLLPDAESGDLLRDEGRPALAELAGRTLAELEGGELGLTLLLPDDAQPLPERAIALHDWVRGFLYGWGMLGLSDSDASAETREILHFFIDGMMRMDLDRLDEDEEAEEALTVLSEHVRVSAMLIYQDRIAAHPSGPGR